LHSPPSFLRAGTFLSPLPFGLRFCSEPGGEVFREFV
jgi:hypothetical protein